MGNTASSVMSTATTASTTVASTASSEVSHRVIDNGHSITIGKKALRDLETLLEMDVLHQDEAVATLKDWVTELANKPGRLFGSVCFAGDEGEMDNCLKILGTCIWGDNNFKKFNMMQYAAPNTAEIFVKELKLAYGSHIIAFQNFAYAHPNVLTIMDQIIHHRTIAENYSFIPFKFDPFHKKLSFKDVMFVGIHTPPLFSRVPLNPREITCKTKKVLTKSVESFDVVVPFVLSAQPVMLGGSSTGREDMLAHPNGTKDSRFSKRGPLDDEDEHTHKAKKVKHNITNNNTNHSNNTSDSNNNTSDSNNNDSNNNITNKNNNNNPLTVINNGGLNPSQRSELSKIADSPFLVRPNTNVEPFVDGEDYFACLYDLFSTAKKEILICGWAMSNIYLKRPYKQHPESKLYKVLENAADRGVAISIMLRNNDSYFCPNKHAFIQMIFESADNVEVSLQDRHYLGIVPALTLSHHQKFVVVDMKIAFVGGLDLTEGRWDTPQHNILDVSDHAVPDEEYLHVGKGTVCRFNQPRTGWHDVQISVEGLIVSDLRDAFRERWNAYNQGNPIRKLPPKQFTPSITALACEARVVRSITGESVGKQSYKERGILRVYCDIISTAESYVYIENQYFIEKKLFLSREESYIFLRTICARIVRASKEKTDFVIVIVLPMFPDNGPPDEKIVQTIMTHQRETVECLAKMLQKEGILLPRYIRFYALQQHDILNGRNVFAQIYVHSKLMISDNKSIVGSCNINHRSLSGNGDTEIGVAVTSREFSTKLVTQLLSEHTGVARAEITNISAFMKDRMDSIAASNASCFSKVYPAHRAKSTMDLKTYDSLPEHDTRELRKVQGHVLTLDLTELLHMHTRATKFWYLNPFRPITK